MAVSAASLQHALDEVRNRLLAERTADGHWVGELSSSPLSTATASFALELAEHDDLAAGGIVWLAKTQNEDGGWGDTTRSISNISTTVLCWSALAGYEREYTRTSERARSWLAKHAGGLEPQRLAAAIAARYGKDRTFSVPILTMAALAGRQGDAKEAWGLVPQLPFELAALPHQWYAALKLPVVSYALPALIAMGLVRHHKRPTRNPIARILRSAATARALGILEKIQPASGGFLEATPLTSFVVMSLIGAGESEHPVVREGIQFLIDSVRPDGSWPIDTNLATWVTTLSINALSIDPDFSFPAPDRHVLLQWLLEQQFLAEHPYTHAAPGGWAWTDLPGGVPDADDTAGALIALHALAPDDPDVLDAAQRGISWLLDLQNRDGGIPTFCRGWTGLPFDRSGADLTAHALTAFAAWRDALPSPLRARVNSATTAAINYLGKVRREEGAWAPLWFGNQIAPNEENFTYGTARVLMGLVNHAAGPADRPAAAYLSQAQNDDGGWGGARSTPSSIEETSLAVWALAAICECEPNSKVATSLWRGVDWLINRIHCGRLEASPIGFYFAKLWYFEKLYPLIYATAALSQVKRLLGTKE